jgi:hypothetical protein
MKTSRRTTNNPLQKFFEHLLHQQFLASEESTRSVTHPDEAATTSSRVEPYWIVLRYRLSSLSTRKTSRETGNAVTRRKIRRDTEVTPGSGDHRNVHDEAEILSAWWNFFTDTIVTTTTSMQSEESHEAPNIVVVYLRTLPRNRNQDSSSSESRPTSLTTSASMIHTIDCCGGGSLFSGNNCCDTPNECCHVDDLTSILYAIQQVGRNTKKNQSSTPAVILMLDSIIPILFRHGLRTTWQFLQSLKQSSRIFFVPVSVEMPFTVLNTNVGRRSHPGTTWILSKADAIINLDNPPPVTAGPYLQADWWRRGIRETGRSLREMIHYEIITSRDKNQRQPSIRILPTSNDDDHSDTITQPSIVSATTNATVTAPNHPRDDPTSDKAKKNKIKLLVHEGGRETTTHHPPVPPEAFHDEELMLGDEDYEYEDPDDDLDL